MEDSCLICGHPTRQTRRGGSAFRECHNCGYGRLDGAFGRADYWGETHDHDASDYWTGAKKSYFTAALRLFEEATDKRRLLDVGGGVGSFCELALERGWDAYSLDISPAATALAAKRLGPERALGSPEQVSVGAFDVATLWCVVAHTLEPHELMTSVRHPLKANGLLWLTTPNFRFQKPYARLRAAAGKPIDFAAEDHVGHFTLKALAELFHATGFSQPRQHFVGITETCLAASSNNPSLVWLKRVYNQGANALSRIGLGNHVSELQVTARAIGANS